MKQNLDSKIWNDFRQGKSYATSALYDMSIDFLYSYGKRFTADENLIMDEIQEMFVYLIQKRTTLGYTDNIKAYLQLTLRRRLYKSLQNIKNVSLDNNSEDSIISFEDELIEYESLAEKREELQKILKNLSPEKREILYYRFSDELDYSQIGEIMSISNETARQRVSRIIKEIRKGLGYSAIFILLNKFL